MVKSEWVEWIKCNILEIIILILVLTLVINTFSTGRTSQIQEKGAKEVSTMEQSQDVQNITGVKEAENPLVEEPPKESVPEGR